MKRERVIDLNCDMGESFGRYKLGLDEEIIMYISSANIACGFHAGDPRVMRQTVELARAKGVGVGAHPGFPDLVGFGRREMRLTPEEITADLVYQVGALRAFCSAAGVELQHVKPHGALYNMASKDPVLAAAIVEGILAVDPSLILFCLAGSELCRVAEERGLRVAHEVFADRAFQPDGTLLPRSQPGSIIHDAKLAAERAVRMVLEGKVTAYDGTEIEVRADTICLHGDTPTAVELARTIREEFERRGIEVRPIGGRR